MDFEFEDTLEPLGILVGAFLVVGALGTLAGTPWTTSASPIASIIQIVGIALAVALGAGLVWLSYTGE